MPESAKCEVCVTVEACRDLRKECAAPRRVIYSLLGLVIACVVLSVTLVGWSIAESGKASAATHDASAELREHAAAQAVTEIGVTTTLIRIEAKIDALDVRLREK